MPVLPENQVYIRKIAGSVDFGNRTCYIEKQSNNLSLNNSSQHKGVNYESQKKFKTES